MYAATNLFSFRRARIQTDCSNDDKEYKTKSATERKSHYDTCGDDG